MVLSELSRNAFGETPLHAACQGLFSDAFIDKSFTTMDLKNIAKAAETLILAGCDVTIKDN